MPNAEARPALGRVLDLQRPFPNKFFTFILFWGFFIFFSLMFDLYVKNCSGISLVSF